MQWLRGFERAPQWSFAVHGEKATACGFADHIPRTLGWRAEAPEPGSTAEL